MSVHAEATARRMIADGIADERQRAERRAESRGADRRMVVEPLPAPWTEARVVLEHDGRGFLAVDNPDTTESRTWVFGPREFLRTPDEARAFARADLLEAGADDLRAGGVLGVPTERALRPGDVSCPNMGAYGAAGNTPFVVGGDVSARGAE